MLFTVFIFFFLLFAIVLFIMGKTNFGGESNGLTVNLRPWSAIPFGLFLLFGFFGCLNTVDPGQVAVPVAFGQTQTPVGSGIHFAMPWVDFHGISVKTHEYTMATDTNDGNRKGDDSVEVKGKDGATGHVDITTTYHVDQSKAGDIYKTLGTGYEEQLIRPTIRSCVVNAYASHNIIDDATIAKGDVELATRKCIEEGTDGVAAGLASRGFIIESVQIRKTGLEDSVQASVDAKVAAQQAADQKVFELAQARGDAEKLRISSAGTADGQQIIKCGAHTVTNADGSVSELPNTGADCVNQLTPEYLQWFYIDTLSKIVQSPNHDTLIIPSGQTVTPLINTGK